MTSFAGLKRGILPARRRPDRRRNTGWNTWVGGALVGALALVAVFGPFLVPFQPDVPNTSAVLQPPSAEHWLGTDALGRDSFTRLVYGGRISLIMGVVPVAVAAVVGVVLGLVAAYYGGATDRVISTVSDMLLAFPTILLALAVVAVLGPNLVNLMIAIGIGWIPSYIRLTRGATLSVKRELYVEASRTSGSRDPAILAVHILPNIASPLIVLGSLGIAQAILTGSALSFIGLGVQPPTAEWGILLSSGRDYITSAWWLPIFPGVAIMLAVLGFNLLGDGLRDRMDPRFRV